LQILHAADLLLDGREIREQPAEPALSDVHGAGTLRFRADDTRELRLGAHEQHVVAPHDHVARELLRELDLTQRLLEVDDVNPVALGEDESPHLGIPPAGLMYEMDTRGETLFERGLRVCHLWCSLFVVGRPPPSSPGTTDCSAPVQAPAKCVLVGPFAT